MRFPKVLWLLLVGAISQAGGCTPESQNALLDPRDTLPGLDPLPTQLDSAGICRQVDSFATAPMDFVVGLDRQFEGLATVLPAGYGGATVQYMVLVEPDKAPLVAEGVRIGATCASAHALDWTLAQRSQVVKGQYDFRQLAHWKRSFYKAGLSDLQIRVFDLDEVRNRVFIGVAASDDSVAVRALASQLAIPQEALIVQVVPPVCTADFRYGINVTVTDSATGSPPDEATLLARSGTFLDSIGPRRPFQVVANGPLVLILSTAGERPGLYSIVVRSPGYRDWIRDGIEVTADECHVRPVNLTARLQRP